MGGGILWYRGIQRLISECFIIGRRIRISIYNLKDAIERRDADAAKESILRLMDYAGSGYMCYPPYESNKIIEQSILIYDAIKEGNWAKAKEFFDELVEMEEK
ncbi:MAG: hypothetical protein QXU90_00500 [Acidilobaceae archaeon]